MNKFVFLVLLVSSVAFFYPCNGAWSDARGYVFSAPGQFLAEESKSVCLALHNLELPANVTVTLREPSWSVDNKVLATATNANAGMETCLQLSVPATRWSAGRLRLQISFEKNPEYVVDEDVDIDIVHDSLLTFVETDKTVYKAGQDVRIRILMLKHDLKPWTQPIPQVWIQNPSLVKVVQWTNVSTENGMAQLEFPLTSEPNLGVWTIKVQKKRSHRNLIHTTSFKVKKYVLPKFKLTINAPEYIIANVENVTWNFCAKYSYGKPVKGKLFFRSIPEMAKWERKETNVPEIYYWSELDSPDGCAEFMFNKEVLGLGRGRVGPKRIVITANFTEAGTGVVETAISSTKVIYTALTLIFEEYTPRYFQQGLPYHGKLRVLRNDDTPASNIQIEICLNVSTNGIEFKFLECRNFTSTIEGYVDFIVLPPNKNVVTLKFTAAAAAYPSTYYLPSQRWRVFMYQPSASVVVKSWYSPSGSYLSIARGYQPFVCGEKYSFNVMYTLPSNFKENEQISFSYSINSKGDLLVHGHVKHKPSRDSILNYSELHNVLGAAKANLNKGDTIVHRFPLSVKITPSMAPVSELMLYYVRSDGEIVAATYTIKVGHCFENKVKTAWHTDVQTPGASTQYHVEASRWSLCGISVVDKSTIFLGESKANFVDAGQTFDELERFDSKPPFRLGSTDCHPKSKRRKRYAPQRGDLYVDAAEAFKDFGVVVITDLVIATRPCPARKEAQSETKTMAIAGPDLSDIFHAMKMPLTLYLEDLTPLPKIKVEQKVEELRSYFPETWLWELVRVGKEGKATIKPTLPDTITDWVAYTTCISSEHGLGIAPPTTLTAFQPFFLEYSLPYSVKRGEMLHLKVSLFNYMQHSIPVLIILEEAPGLELHLSNSMVSFCVNPRDSIVHEFILIPRVLGEVNITVSAVIDSTYPAYCGPDTLIFTRDVIVKPILIVPEGFPVDVTKSAYICPKDYGEDYLINWNLELPANAVPDSERGYVSLIDDLLGPALENLDNLVRLPTGCGEQNMVLFVPNIYVIRYLDTIGIENFTLRAKAIKNIEKGYQRELIYRHSDGSYSVFGPKISSSPSIWLTAFVLKSFAQAQSLIHIDQDEILLSGQWITKKQLQNGCYPIIGKVLHTSLKGGMEDFSSALTAYILISLHEANVTLKVSHINSAINCVRGGMTDRTTSLYTIALSTYALTLWEHPDANSSMNTLMDRATRYKDLIWWEDKTKSSMSLNIEMTAYAILSLVKLGGEKNMKTALFAVRWLSMQRNAKGGFISTQDTVVGLEALTKYAIALNNNSREISVTMTAKQFHHVHKINSENHMVLTEIRLPVLPTTLKIEARGEGCVLVQSNIKYNVLQVTGSDALDLSVAANSIPFADECSVQEIKICARYKLADEESNMALLDIGMISGYLPDRTSLNNLLGQPSTKVKRIEEENDVVSIYFDKLTGENTCIAFKVNREAIVDYFEPANVRLYDYYHQELTVSSSYNFAPVCSSAAPSVLETNNNYRLYEFTMNAETANKEKSNDHSNLEMSEDDSIAPVRISYNKSIAIDNSDTPQVESGSGVTPNKLDANINVNLDNYDSNKGAANRNLSFIVIDHELETPDGVEGPAPGYLNPYSSNYKPKTSDTVTRLPDSSPTTEIDSQLEDKKQEEPSNATGIDEDHSSATGAKQFCPTCSDKLPYDISNIYCSAKSAVEAIIPRRYTIKLLLDLHASREFRSLQGIITFTLSPNCSCPPLDSLGSMVLIINKDNDILASGKQNRTLNDSYFVYRLSSMYSMLRNISEVRSTCSN